MLANGGGFGDEKVEPNLTALQAKATCSSSSVSVEGQAFERGLWAGILFYVFILFDALSIKKQNKHK